MGEEFQGVVCGGNWWNSSRNLFGSSPCSSSINDICSFTGWSSGQQHPLTTSPSPNYAPLDQDLAQSQPLAPSATIDHSWNQDLMYNNSGKSEPNYSQESAALNPNMHFSDYFPMNSSNQDFPLEQDSLNSASYGYTTSSLLQTLFETDSQPHQLLTNQLPMKYLSVENCPMIDDLSPMLSKSSPNHLKFNDNTIPVHSSNSQFFLPPIDNVKISISNFTRKHHNEEAAKMGTMAKNAITEPALKRPRMETPSPLPTFKVRKEKLGDRVTALQQLVSPFGKTDTASVLHEAIEYIKFLHDQVTVLSTPYLKKGSPSMQCQQAADKNKDQQEGPKQDLRSRGLCLVPITSTFPVATESPTDFWTPTFGGSFR